MATWLRPQALLVRALVLILSSSGLAGPVRAAPPPAAPASRAMFRPTGFVTAMPAMP